MTSYIQSNQIVKIADAATYTISPVDSGKILVLDLQNQPLAVTLPALQAGLSYKIIVGGVTAGTGAGDHTTFTPAVAANIVCGTLINKTGATAVAYVSKSLSANARITETAVNGDYMTLNCDGTKWYVSGLSSVVGFA